MGTEIWELWLDEWIVRDSNKNGLWEVWKYLVIVVIQTILAVLELTCLWIPRSMFCGCGGMRCANAGQGWDGDEVELVQQYLVGECNLLVSLIHLQRDTHVRVGSCQWTWENEVGIGAQNGVDEGKLWQQIERLCWFCCYLGSIYGVRMVYYWIDMAS